MWPGCSGPPQAWASLSCSAVWRRRCWREPCSGGTRWWVQGAPRVHQSMMGAPLARGETLLPSTPVVVGHVVCIMWIAATSDNPKLA